MMLTLGQWVILFVSVVVTSHLESSDGQKHQVSEETLVLTHVLFRHGNRTADGLHELYPKDPYVNEKYFPYGLGQLTNIGKRKEFGIGKALRTRYNDFFGKYYYPEVIEAYSTDYNRTKMSLQLVLAGLFPPTDEQIWDDGLYWQPVPFNYLPRYNDKILLGVLCPRYLELYEAVSLSPEMQAEFAKHKKEFSYISEHTGLNVTRFYDVYNLYFGISTEEEWGFKLPEWTKSVWPETITSLAIKDYFVSMATSEMRKMATGYFIQKIIEDTKQKILSSKKQGRKIYLYSAHENNIAEMLMSLDVFEPHVPNYGAYLIVEVHYIDKIYGVKIYYENYIDENGPKLLKMPKCEEFCPLEEFINLLQDFIPTEDICGF